MGKILEQAQALREVLDSIGEELDDVAALDVKEIFPLWQEGKAYSVGDRVRFGEVLYRVIQAHSAQSDWTPPLAASLFCTVNLSNRWTQGEAVSKGDVRDYDGISYTCIQAHTAQAGWEPPNVPALWRAQE